MSCQKKVTHFAAQAQCFVKVTRLRLSKELIYGRPGGGGGDSQNLRFARLPTWIEVWSSATVFLGPAQMMQIMRRFRVWAMQVMHNGESMPSYAMFCVLPFCAAPEPLGCGLPQA